MLSGLLSSLRFLGTTLPCVPHKRRAWALRAGQEALECVCIHAWQGLEGVENAGAQDQE